MLTGAGCSTESGIPDYRGPRGTWNRRKPMLYSEFIRSESSRRHYWARNYRGWPIFDAALPNPTHTALARLEAGGYAGTLITQNVDSLHRRAGSQNVIELHGQSDRVVCLECGTRSKRLALQERMKAANPEWTAIESAVHPDADVEIDREATSSFEVPPCLDCGGVLKPDVVFFGENVPRARVEAAMAAVSNAPGLLIIGSSLTVWSGYRFALRADELGIPIVVVNVGPTRADALASVRITARCGDLIPRVAATLR